jgi:hypothetical protein
MTEEEWFEFIASGRPRVVSVGRLDGALRSAIDSATSLVQMSHDYAQKVLCKHRVLPQHFRVISWAISHGIAFQDGPRHLTFFWRDEYAGWFHVTVKSNTAGTELWLSTFHRTTQAKVSGKLKSVKILRDRKI